MAFSLVPQESKNLINKAGDVLTIHQADTQEFKKAVGLAEKWRACHAYPINTFQSTLRRKCKKFSGNPIVAQRLKRMSTIIDKLKRYPKMHLTTMQDIGGVRAVMNSVRDLYKLAGVYRDNIRFPHQLVNQKDYIENPRNEDGYRSLHLIYRYKNKRASHYNRLLLELQLRTKLQHSWATAVETMGTFLGQALKSRQGDKEWLDFFAIVSSAFAYMEKTNLVPRYAGMSHKQTFKEVAKANEELHVLDKIRGYSVAVNEIVKKGTSDISWSFHLIILNSLQKTVQIKPYKRGAFKQAVADYAKVEEQAALGKKIEAVLVSVGPIDVLRKAYPNFFLDIREFVKYVEYIIKNSK